jgi:hypothetical protein
MDSLQLVLLENALQEVLYSQALGKSSLWLLGNISMFLLFASVLLFFAVLNYKQRKVAGVEERSLEKTFSLLKRFIGSKLKLFDSGILPVFKKYSFYIEFIVVAAFFAFLTHISIFTAFVFLALYVIFRLFLFKRTLKLFKRKPGVVVPVGIYVLFSVFFLILLFIFNALPALVEVSAENEMMRSAQSGVLQK